MKQHCCIQIKNISRISKLFVSLTVLFCIAGVTYANNSAANASVQSAAEQSVLVRGTIVDSQGLPIIGAAIQVQGTNNGTITNIDGKFELRGVSTGANLEVTCIGYVSQTIKYTSGELNIVLAEDNVLLEDVVVVGYGQVKKESLTGAITNVNSEDINSTKTENLITNIQGKMPGLLIRQKTGEPGTFDNMVSIRGYGTPLIVIDGVTREGTDEFAQLSSDDIESISILKDASAAIYGMNAANGVIIVTTKKGKSEKARVTLSTMVGMKAATGIESTVDAYTYRLMANERDRNDKATPTYTDEILEKYRTGVNGYVDHNWMDMYMNRFAMQQQHSISVRGGSEKVRYFVSFGYNNDNGLLKSGVQKYSRYNFRSNVSAEIAKGLDLNINVSGGYNLQQQPREDFMWVYKTLMVNDRGVGPFTINNPEHYSLIAPENKNAEPLVNPEIDGYRQNRSLNYSMSTELSWKVPFVKGLTLSALGSFNGRNNNNSTLQKSYPFYDYYTDAPAGRGGADLYNNTMRLYEKLYGRLQANYNKKVNQHTFNGTLVAEATHTRSDYLYGYREYEFYTNDILDQASAATASNSGNRNLTRLAAFLGRFNYDYAGKYLLEVVGRYDGSYRYAPAKRWAFFPSASAGWRISEESFVKDNLSFITNLKLRASYGLSGWDAGNAFSHIYAYSQKDYASYVFDGSNLTTGMEAPGLVDDKMSWVKSKIANIGLDYDFFRGKLFGSVEFFQRVNEGILASRIQSVPDTFGASFPQENINSNKNFGFEVSVGTRGKIGDDFFYSASANITYARSMNLHVERAAPTSSWNNWQSNTNNRYQGYYPMYSYDGQYTSIEQYETAPLLGGNQGNSKMLPGSYRIIDTNGDGIINSTDRSNFQYWTSGSNPPIQYGLTLTASWKGFELSALFQGASGFIISYPNDDVWGYGSRTNKTYLISKYTDRWHPATAGADPYDPATQWVSGFYPALRYNFNNTTDNGNSYRIDIWKPDATYVRLKSLDIAYNLPKNFVKNLGISNARVFLSGSNLFTICNKLLKNADPEREERDWAANLAYPLMKTYNIGLNITF